MEDKLQKLLDDKATPMWSRLLEEAIGQVANYMNRIGDYSIAEEFHPNMKEFTMDNFISARWVEDIPKDWLAFIYACMERIGL